MSFQNFPQLITFRVRPLRDLMVPRGAPWASVEEDRILMDLRYHVSEAPIHGIISRPVPKLDRAGVGEVASTFISFGYYCHKCREIYMLSTKVVSEATLQRELDHLCMYGTTQTDTATLQVQNISGDTVARDVALALAQNEFVGAFVYVRLWHGAAETALVAFMGNITDVELDETSMTLSIESFKNFSAIKAPAFTIDVACGLYFGSTQCGSTGALCQQTYGTCSSIERFQGVIIQWDNGQLQLPSQIAQPAPAAAYNPARAF